MNVANVKTYPNVKWDHIKTEGWQSVREKIRQFIAENSLTIDCDYIVADFIGYSIQVNSNIYSRSEIEYRLAYAGVKWFSGDFQYFESLKNMDIRRWTPIKIGKLIRKLFPELSDKQIESIVVEVSDRYSVPEYELIVGDTREHFLKAYTSEVASRPTPRYGELKGFYTKSLSASCMQGNQNQPIHPCEVYASGDFEVHYVLNKKTGKIAARTIVGNESATNVYMSCQVAGEMLIDSLIEKGIASEPNWEGLMLKAIPYPREGKNAYVAVYVDEYDKASFNGDYFVIDPYGSCHIQTTRGYTYAVEEVMCEDCEDSVSEDCITEVILSNGESGCVCNNCRYDNYLHSYLMDTYIHDSLVCQSEAGDYATQDWFDSNGYVLCECSEVYCEKENCIEYDGAFYSKDCDCVVFANDCYYHENDPALIGAQAKELVIAQAYKTEKTEVRQKYLTIARWYDEENIYNWVLDRDTRVVEVIETEYQTVLRDNYELDSTGFPIRNPELPGLELTAN